MFKSLNDLKDQGRRSLGPGRRKRMTTKTGIRKKGLGKKQS
jgi:hypothetical protein